MNLQIAKQFPKGKARQGEPTNFKELILNGTKIHTVRLNYDYWYTRAKTHNELRLVEWLGLPYRSKVQLIKTVPFGIQRLEKRDGKWFVENKEVSVEALATNDGLTMDDFLDFFKEVKEFEPMAIIHFTNFSYLK